MPIFTPALDWMAENDAVTYGPMSFHGYQEDNGLEVGGTWSYISVDSVSRLRQELRDERTMVFRLGAAEGEQHTSFALSRLPSGEWADFFLLDDALLQAAALTPFLPSSSMRELFAFQLLPKLTETSCVNLALSSGLLHAALELGEADRGVIPGTGQSSFTFDVRPYNEFEGVWQHRNGQVEIDALFVAKRSGVETLFLVEAKTGSPNGSLAKHKLVYPLASLRTSVPSYIQIVPVYLKSWSEEDGRHFLITECQHSTTTPFSIAELSVARVSHWVLHGFNG